jgi:hypothetical protein
MAERQEHAFEYESRIILENNIIKSEGYTDKWDAFENDIPVSVKNIKLNSGVDFGDFKRQTLLSQDFYLYVGFWQTDKTNIVKEYKILISFENWKKYFGDITIIQDMIGEMKQISNDRSDDGKWKEFRKKWNLLYKKFNSNPVITLRFKRDHKKQKRIQCGISSSNFKKLIDENQIIWQR